MKAQPNILIIMTDQQAPQFSGPYGHPTVKTPTLDRLASEGVVFENAYTNCPICVPARMSYMTGRYVQNIGIWDNGVPLPEDTITWAHRLRAAGYSVSISGKIHFRGNDHLHGFEEQIGFDLNATAKPTPPDWSKPTPSKPQASDMRCGPGNTPEIETDTRVTAAALEYIRDAARKTAPWALHVGYVCPHSPFIAPERYFEMYNPDRIDIDLPEMPPGHLENQHPAVKRNRAARGQPDATLPDAVVRRVRASYYGLITFVDDMVGQLIEALESTGQRDDTLIIFTADHGEMMGEHGMWMKSNFYEHSSRIPMILSAPNQPFAGKRISDPVSLVDLVSTIVSVAGAATPEEPLAPLDGTSLLPLIHGEGKGPDDVFSEYYANFSAAPMAMLRRGKYKFNYYLHEDAELYDLEDDPGEFRNLASDSDHRNIREDLENRLLERWDPHDIEERILASQADRRFLKPYLYRYLYGANE
jgi:choline-sulfatase